jgi:hypothetical protein
MTHENRYPDADVLGQRGHWDKATRDVVLDRVHNVPPFKHFHGSRRATLEALCERVIPQAEKPAERRVPIAPWIDAHCASDVLEGFRFDNMPANSEAWQNGLDGLDQAAQALFGRPFADLNGEGQDEVLRRVRAGDPPGAIWRDLPPKRWWTYVALRQIAGVYYAHPYAWDAIGFGGPAYPRGYFALNFGAPEPWEPREKRDGKGRGR